MSFALGFESRFLRLALLVSPVLIRNDHLLSLLLVTDEFKICCSSALRTATPLTWLLSPACVSPGGFSLKLLCRFSVRLVGSSLEVAGCIGGGGGGGGQKLWLPSPALS